MSDWPLVGMVGGIDELAAHYAQPPDGLRANMIFSADGAAAFAGRAGSLSCPTDQRLLRVLRGFADVVLVGAGTARAENYGPVHLTDEQRTARHRDGHTRPPPIAVVSRSGELPGRLLSDSEQPPILLTCAQTAARDDLPGGLQVLVAGEESVDVVGALELLRERGLRRILCEGGPTLLDELVENDAVDEICVTLAPKLAANQPVRQHLQPSGLAMPVEMALEHGLVYDDYLFLKYRRQPRG